MSTASPSGSSLLRRVAPFAVLAAAIVAVLFVLRAWTDERAGSRALGRAATCYYDGAARSDCPTPPTGAHADSAWIHAAVIDTLYTRVPGGVGPATRIALREGTAMLPAALGAAGGPGQEAVVRALVTAAPALPAETARALVRDLAVVNVVPVPIGVLRTVGAKQKRYDPASAARAVAGQPTDKEEALPPRGLLALARPALDPSRQWGLAYAERTILPELAGAPASVERAIVLLTRTADGRWRALRIVPG